MDKVNKIDLTLFRKCTEKLPSWWWCSTEKPTITCGLLPTLRVLGSRGCELQGSVCLVPADATTDSASHLQLTLLEAYCREIGIQVGRVSENKLRSVFGNHDLSCVLVTNEHFVEAPE
uniref:Ribosomal protein L7Ae/L30e/S12e/Gadd45 domain-containing protein n=1 Tax=Bracon brevicornis TaxID=1563983 RepID=A0A6V7LG56_9HYME